MNRYVLFPFRGGALTLLLTFTVGQEIALYAGWMGLPLAVALLSWFFKYCFILLDAIVIGAAEPPVLSVEMINPLNEQRPLGQALLIGGGVALCLAAGKALGVVMGWLTGAVLLLLLPASIATLGMTGHLLRAAWPPELWSVIRGVGRHYLLLITAIPGLALFFVALGHYGASSWVLIGGGQLSFLLAFALIGSVLHEHRLELGIEYRTMEEHIAERTEREHASERNRMMDHAYMKFRVGKPLEGWHEIQTWLTARRVPAGGSLAGRSVVPAGDSFAARSVTQAEPSSSLRRREHSRAERFHDLHRALHQLPVGGEHSLPQVKIVFEPDAGITAQNHSLGDHRHLHSPDTESRPYDALR
jgi:hypothetical protein